MSHTAIIDTVPIKDIKALRQMAEALRKKGIDVELVQDAVPRMYYPSQIQEHLKNKGKELRYHKNVEECDFVLRVKGAFYDIGFLRDMQGNLLPLFDDYAKPSPFVPATGKGSGPISKYLKGAVEVPGAGALNSIGQVLQNYSLFAACNAATDAGYTVLGTAFDKQGQVVLEVEVGN